MKNLDVEKAGLIDITLEDDFLIDKRFDNNLSVDLRLSVSFETQMELISDLKPRARVGLNDRIRYLADTEYQGHGDDNARNSLAWDNAFFTSPGFLELEELCLVNSGFKDPQRQSVCGDRETTRRKICMARNKSRVAAGCRQSTRSLPRTKIASPTKMTTKQDSQCQMVTTRRSEAFSGATSKSPVTQEITKKKEHLKSSKATGHKRFLTALNKKAPLQNRTPERLKSVASSLTFIPSTPNDMPVELSPYRRKDNAVQTVKLMKSQETKGECVRGSHSPYSADSRHTDVEEPSLQGTQVCASTNASYTLNSGGRQNKQIFRQTCTKQVNSGRELQRQNATRGTKSPLSANNQNSGMSTVDESTLLSPELHNACNVKSVNRKGTQLKEKENMFACEDHVIELEPKTRSPLPVGLGENRSSKRGKIPGLSRKPSVAAQRIIRQTNVSPLNSRKSFSTKISPMQRSSFF